MEQSQSDNKTCFRSFNQGRTFGRSLNIRLTENRKKTIGKWTTRTFYIQRIHIFIAYGESSRPRNCYIFKERDTKLLSSHSKSLIPVRCRRIRSRLLLDRYQCASCFHFPSVGHRDPTPSLRLRLHNKAATQFATTLATFSRREVCAVADASLLVSGWKTKKNTRIWCFRVRP